MEPLQDDYDEKDKKQSKKRATLSSKKTVGRKTLNSLATQKTLESEKLS